MGKAAGSSPAFGTTPSQFARVKHFTCNEEMIGSNPMDGTTKTCLLCDKGLTGKNRYKSTYCSCSCFTRHKFLKRHAAWLAGENVYPGGQSYIGLKNSLKHEFGRACSVCSLTHWLEQEIPLEVDHLDGDGFNNSVHNVRLVCPNCHALTPNYKAKNKNSTRIFRKTA